MIYGNSPRIPAFNRAHYARIYHIHELLNNNRYPRISDIAEEFEVSTRTVERDIEHMRDRLGAPICYDYSRRGYYYEKEGFQLPPFHISEEELIALFMGQKLLSQFMGTPYEKTIRNALRKILSVIPEVEAIDLGSINDIVSFDVKPLRGDEDRVLDNYSRLAAAIENRKKVWLRYYSASSDEVNERYVDPYHLRYHQGAWYLIGYCNLRKAMRIFALDRILDLKNTEDPFVFLKGFVLEDYLSSALGIETGDKPQEVVIRFDRDQARWICERCWHHTQRIEPQADGSVILRITVSGLREVKRWVLGFGGHAEVLYPEKLRKELAKEAEGMLNIYTG
ncbi:MAG: transcriptional regulator [Bacillota bacterium]|nr:transcriptional regulator [Bacillota bacterium]MDD3851822.1 transcriptional regulator [Bacillota bacterium]MDD4707854.1 transcriptional regulator [Bacillota bacterium]